MHNGLSNQLRDHVFGLATSSLHSSGQNKI